MLNHILLEPPSHMIQLTACDWLLQSHQLVVNFYIFTTI